VAFGGRFLPHVEVFRGLCAAEPLTSLSRASIRMTARSAPPPVHFASRPFLPSFREKSRVFAIRPVFRQSVRQALLPGPNNLSVATWRCRRSLFTRRDFAATSCCSPPFHVESLCPELRFLTLQHRSIGGECTLEHVLPTLGPRSSVSGFTFVRGALLHPSLGQNDAD
jgi:hypothetical protein